MDGYVIIGTELDTKGFDAQISQLEDKLDTLSQEYEAALEDQEFPADELKKYASEIEQTKNKIIALKEKQDELNSSNLSKLPQAINNIGNQVGGVITKVGKWALAIFGIRSAYNMIRGAVSALSSENEQIATDIEYMRWILAQTLKPVVEWIIKGLYLIITLINAISNSVFGVNLLANKGADNFKKMQKSVGGVSAGLKEAKKQLAGFDEMNILQDNTSGGSGGVGGIGGGMGNWEAPNFDEYSNEINKMKDNWMSFGEEMRRSIEDMPFSIWLKAFQEWGVAVYGVTTVVYGLWEVITGFGEFVVGLVQMIYGLITGNTELVKKGIVNTLDGLWKIIDGFINVVKGSAVAVMGLIVGLVVNLWNLIALTINDAVKLINNGIEKIKGFFNGMYSTAKVIISGLFGLFGQFGVKVGDVVGSAFKGAVNAALSSIELILNTPIKAINTLIGAINVLPGIKLTKLSTFKLQRLAKGGIINMPSKGVLVGNAIAGERGAEGVIPITDSQQMALLGEAIGKYITINANITNTMNGRVISRELQKVQNDSDFAYNR